MGQQSPIINIYQIAGIDERERGFNRQVQVIKQEPMCQARLRYETLQLESESAETEELALQGLIQCLQVRGYTQLRTQLIFQGEEYLGNKEFWVDYPDSELSAVQPISWFMRLRQVLGIGEKKDAGTKC